MENIDITFFWINVVITIVHSFEKFYSKICHHHLTTIKI